MVKKTDADSKGAGKPAEEVQEKKPRRRKPANSSASGSPENDAGSCLISEGKPNEAQLINEGISAFNCQDYAKARQIFERAYRQHDFRSCYYMGMMALSGNGLPKDEQLAVTYFEEGAKNSCPWSRYQLGVMYRTGTGVPRNLSRGNKYLKDLAQYFADNEGKILLSDPYPETLYFVGQMGVRSKELDKAADLFTRARVFLSQRIAEDYAAPDENDLLLMDNLVAALFRQGEFDVFDIDLFDLMFLFRAGFVEVSFVYKGRLQKVSSSTTSSPISWAVLSRWVCSCGISFGLKSSLHDEALRLATHCVLCRRIWILSLQRHHMEHMAHLSAPHSRLCSHLRRVVVGAL